MTYTTVGFGDVVPLGAICFMAGVEALTGLVMITWSPRMRSSRSGDWLRVSDGAVRPSGRGIRDDAMNEGEFLQHRAESTNGYTSLTPMLRVRLFNASATACQRDAQAREVAEREESVATRSAGWPGTRTVSPWLLAVSNVSTMCR